jgi:hypothetical protein
MAAIEFQDRCLRPLGHPSTQIIPIRYEMRTGEHDRNACRFGPNFGPNLIAPRGARSYAVPSQQRADDRRRTRVGLLGAASVAAQQDRGIMAAAGGNDMHGNAGVEKQGFLEAVEIMEPQTPKPQLGGSPNELLGDATGVPWAVTSSAGDGKISA